jgi:L-2-hydroxyglutarate oxidase
MDGLVPRAKIVAFRGDYYRLRAPKVRNLIYPVPDPDFPFLGVHLTRMIDGTIECGPNAVFSFKREGYSRTAFSPTDAWDALTFSGTRRFFAQHWKKGWREYRRAFSKSLFLNTLRRLAPSLEPEDLAPARSGVRALALSPDGELLDDFVFLETDRAVHVLNAPSPAATACLAIGRQIAQKIVEKKQ